MAGLAEASLLWMRRTTFKLEDAIYRISCCEREKKEEPQNFKFQMQSHVRLEMLTQVV
jgi:hypothetical protein